MANILIAGCGELGMELARRPSMASHRFWGLRRNPTGFPENLQPLAADLTDPETLRDLPRALDTVIYTATPGGRSAEAYERAYVTGVGNLLGALADSSPDLSRFIYVSSTSVYSQSDGGWIDKASPANPAGVSGAAVLQGEHLVGASAVPGTIIRFGGIYGPGRFRLIERVLAGTPCVESPPQYTNRIHRDDCVGVLAHVIGLDTPAACYLAVDDEPAPECGVYDWLAAQLGVAAPPRQALEPGARRAGSKRCSNARLKASGYEFQVPDFRAGYARLLAEYRSRRAGDVAC